MILTKEEYMEKVKNIVGDRTDDEAIKIVEDFTDTYTDLESKTKEDPEDWKSKYEQLDEEWRKKYKERFFSGDVKDTVEEKEEKEEEKDGDEKEETVEDILEEMYK